MKVLVGKDILTRRRVVHFCLQWQPRDMWLGVFVESWKPLRLYMCILPCFPLHIRIEPNFPRRVQKGEAA